MRLHTRGFIVALLTLTLAVSACTAAENDAPANTSASSSSAPDTTTDIVMQDASFRHIIGVANKALGSNIDARFVAKDRTESCKLHGEAFGISGDESLMTPCEEGYIALPEGVKTDPEWMAKPAIGIWYEVTLNVVQAQPSYGDDILKGSCVTAHVVARKPGYQRTSDGEQLLAFMKNDEYGTDAIESVRSGLDAATAGQAFTTCKSS